MKRTALAFSFVVFLIASCLINIKPGWAALAVENSWTTKAPLPQTEGGLRAAAVNGKIYVIGADINYGYDPASGTWTAKKPMPTARTYFGIAVYQNRIYIIGGYPWPDVSGSIPTGTNEVYDPLTDTWETKEPMPTNRSSLNANVVDGKIYLIGGRTGGQFSTVALNEVYDVANDSWTTGTPIPYPVVSYASAVVNNKIYVIGGQNEFHAPGSPLNIDSNQIYDPENDTWSQGAPLPTTVLDAAAGATTGIMAPKKIYVIGGKPSGSIEGTNITQAYDPENDTWTYGAPMPTARGWLAVAVVNDMLYAIGGAPGLMLSWMTTNEQYTPFGYGTVPPKVSIVSPENMNYTLGNVSLVFTVNKPALWMGYSLDGQDNVTVAGNTTLSGLTGGLHNVTVYAKDEFENTGASETMYFSVEEPFPTTLVATASAASAAIIGIGLLIYFRKRSLSRTS